MRYFNAAGADPDGEIGECHVPETHALPLMLDAAAGAAAGFTIFGDDYPTADGTCIRDYIHVSDLADAHVTALRALLDGAASAAFNLGTGRGWSVRELVEAVRRITNRDLKVRVGPRRPGDPPVLVADATRARQNSRLATALFRSRDAGGARLGVAPGREQNLETDADDRRRGRRQDDTASARLIGAFGRLGAVECFGAPGASAALGALFISGSIEYRLAGAPCLGFLVRAPSQLHSRRAVRRPAACLSFAGR